VQNSQPTVIYFPGYNSGKTSSTFLAIREALSDIAHVFCVEYDDQNPANAKAALIQQIDDFKKGNVSLFFVGSSLGGYWCNYFAQYYLVDCVLINPSFFPKNNLRKYGIEEQLLHLYEDSVFENTIARTLFLGTNDDIIDNKKTAEILNETATILWLEEAHQIKDKMPIIEKIKQLIS